jgi:hypothetical protein
MDIMDINATDADLLAEFRHASRRLHDAFLPLLGRISSVDLQEELDGHFGRLRGLLDLHRAENG